MTRTPLTRHTPLRRSRFKLHGKRSRVTKDGRTILQGRNYSTLRRLVYILQGGQCAGCGNVFPFEQMELHHKKGRGMGGSKRDDVPHATELRCHPCHEKESAQPEWRANATRKP